jgi:hypothetical protein
MADPYAGLRSAVRDVGVGIERGTEGVRRHREALRGFDIAEAKADVEASRMQMEGRRWEAGENLRRDQALLVGEQLKESKRKNQTHFLSVNDIGLFNPLMRDNPKANAMLKKVFGEQFTQRDGVSGIDIHPSQIGQILPAYAAAQAKLREEGDRDQLAYDKAELPLMIKYKKKIPSFAKAQHAQIDKQISDLKAAIRKAEAPKKKTFRTITAYDKNTGEVIGSYDVERGRKVTPGDLRLLTQNPNATLTKPTKEKGKLTENTVVSELTNLSLSSVREGEEPQQALSRLYKDYLERRKKGKSREKALSETMAQEQDQASGIRLPRTGTQKDYSSLWK